MRNWATTVLGATGDYDVLPTIGSKELIALLPTYLESKKVLYPEVAYPTYLVGAMIAHAAHQAVEIDVRTWPEDADLVWSNSPSNPTGRIASREELESIIDYGRRTGAVIASDECYINFPAELVEEPTADLSGESAPAQANMSIPIPSILSLTQGDNRGILAVHSLSKRSNIAGYRAGLIVGDPELIKVIREIRKHAGALLPAPIQVAMARALGDERHVKEQAIRYANRRKKLAPALEALGFTIEDSRAGLYIWCTRNEVDMKSVEELAKIGILVTPGHFYGAKGAQHIRVALTASDQSIALASDRIHSFVLNSSDRNNSLDGNNSLDRNAASHESESQK